MTALEVIVALVMIGGFTYPWRLGWETAFGLVVALCLVGMVMLPLPWNLAAILALGVLAVPVSVFLIAVETREWLARRRLRRASWL